MSSKTFNFSLPPNMKITLVFFLDRSIAEYKLFTFSLPNPETPQREDFPASLEYSLAAYQVKENAFDLEISTSFLT